MRREYKSGTKYCIWQWKEIFWRNELYLTRLILIQCPLFSVMLHWIHAPDKQRHLHDHPVSMICFVLSGYYCEYTKTSTHKIQKPRLVNWVNWIPFNKQHQIVIISKSPVITLCFAGRRVQEWGFYTKNGWIPHKEYQELYG